MTEEHVEEMMATIGDALSQDASVQPYALRGDSPDEYREEHPEAEVLLQRRKNMVRAESKGSGGTQRTVAKRPAERISEVEVEDVSEVAVVSPSPPATPVRCAPKRRLTMLSTISMAGFDEVGAPTALHPKQTDLTRYDVMHDDKDLCRQQVSFCEI